MTIPTHPHGDAVLHEAGVALDQARGAAIVLHGRGGGAASMFALVDQLDPGELHYRLPQAVGNSWYPQKFTAPRQANEPYLSSALAVVERQIADLTHAGIPARRLALVGFSQGACLALDCAARQQMRLGAVIALAGGLIGEAPSAEGYPGALESTPVLMAVSDDDPHIPLERAQASAATLETLGAAVELRTYSGLGHWVGEDSLSAAHALLWGLAR